MNFNVENEHSEHIPFENDMHLHSLSCSLSLNDFHSSVSKMTKSQLEVLEHVKLKFEGKSFPFYVFVSGGAGVGKSFLTKAIVAYLQLFTSKTLNTNPVVVCAPTGTADNNINGETLHSLLKIPVHKFVHYSSVSPYCLKQLRKKFQNVHTIILDEVSMGSSSMLTFISRRLSEISDNNLPFGGYNVITVGDFFQLRPVKGNFAFENILLWRLFEPFFLTENMRQNANATFFNLLNRVRFGLPSELDITILKSRLIRESTDYENMLHIFPLRKQVEQYNNHLLSKIGTNIISISASHYFSQSDQNALASVDSNYIPTDDRLAGGLCNILQIAINARVMLIRNIHTESGLVNGAMGTISDISYETRNGHSEPTKIYVLFDNQSIGRLNCASGTLMHNPIPIELVQHEFSYGGRQIVRMQFPLVLSWSCTVHKIQGLSLDNAVIHLGSDVFEKGMAYVALSRVRTVQGLFILSLDPSRIVANDIVIDEYERLKNIIKKRKY